MMSPETVSSAVSWLFIPAYLVQALDRSEARRDGGYKHNWSFSHSDDSEEERRHE